MLFGQRLWQAKNELPNFVANTTIVAQGRFFIGRGCRQRWWVIEAFVNDPRDRRKIRACFIGVATNCNHVIELPVAQLTRRLTVMTGDINANLLHDLHCIRIQTMSLDAGPRPAAELAL